MGGSALRHFYNEDRPHRSIGQKVPSEVHNENGHSHACGGEANQIRTRSAFSVENANSFSTKSTFREKSQSYSGKDRQGPYNFDSVSLFNIINISKKLKISGFFSGHETMYSDQNLLQILMDNITDTIYFKDKDCKFIKVNKAQVQLVGAKSTDEVIGKTDFDFFNIEFAKESFAVEQRIIFDGKPINKLEFVGTHDGVFRWLSSSKVPIFDKTGAVVGIVGITRNVDKMIKVEHRLKSERDLLQLRSEEHTSELQSP